MGKKKGSGNAQQAMQRQITNIQLKAMQPFIAQQVQQMAGQVQQSLAKQQMTYMSDILTRLSVVENIICEKLGYTKADLEELILDNEDRILKLDKVIDRGAEKGDYLRVEFFAKPTETPEGQEPQEYQEKGQLYIVKDLMEENSKHIHDQVVLSEALIGMKAGEEKEEILEEHKVAVKLKISRISKKQLIEEPAKVEETNA